MFSPPWGPAKIFMFALKFPFLKYLQNWSTKNLTNYDSTKNHPPVFLVFGKTLFPLHGSYMCFMHYVNTPPKE